MFLLTHIVTSWTVNLTNKGFLVFKHTLRHGEVVRRPFWAKGLLATCRTRNAVAITFEEFTPILRILIKLLRKHTFRCLMYLRDENKLTQNGVITNCGIFLYFVDSVDRIQPTPFVKGDRRFGVVIVVFMYIVNNCCLIYQAFFGLWFLIKMVALCEA